MPNQSLTTAAFSPYLFARAMDDGFQYINFAQMKKMKMSAYVGEIAGMGSLGGDQREILFWKLINYLTQFLGAIPEDGVKFEEAVTAVKKVFFDDDATGADLCTVVDKNFKVVDPDNPGQEG